MQITLVAAAGPADRDRTWLTAGGRARRGPVHVIHDLQQLVVESLSGIADGLRAEPIAPEWCCGRAASTSSHLPASDRRADGGVPAHPARH
jgi:hypothetical protein